MKNRSYEDFLDQEYVNYLDEQDCLCDQNDDCCCMSVEAFEERLLQQQEEASLPLEDYA